MPQALPVRLPDGRWDMGDGSFIEANGSITYGYNGNESLGYTPTGASVPGYGYSNPTPTPPPPTTSLQPTFSTVGGAPIQEPEQPIGPTYLDPIDSQPPWGGEMQPPDKQPGWGGGLQPVDLKPPSMGLTPQPVTYSPGMPNQHTGGLKPTPVNYTVGSPNMGGAPKDGQTLYGPGAGGGAGGGSTVSAPGGPPTGTPPVIQVPPGAGQAPGTTGAVPTGTLRGRGLPVRRTLNQFQSNSQEIPLLAGLFSAAGKDPAAEFGEFRQFLPRGNRNPLTRY